MTRGLALRVVAQQQRVPLWHETHVAVALQKEIFFLHQCLSVVARQARPSGVAVVHLVHANCSGFFFGSLWPLALAQHLTDLWQWKMFFENTQRLPCRRPANTRRP